MKTVDNIEIVKSLLSFDDKDTFYVVEIIRRKKENADLGSNSRVIKTYYVNSLSYLDEFYSEMRVICNALNARACIYLCKKSYEKAYSLHLKKMGELLISRDLRVVNKMYSKAAVFAKKDSNNTTSWIVDVDDVSDESQLDLIKDALFKIRPEGDKVIATIPSRTGFHLITKRFDVIAFKKLGLGLDIHKNNPTNLYIP
jgi:hypothetical protein